MKKAIAVLLLLMPLFALSQNTFEPGYFVENGIKTECLIKNLAWKNNPSSIEYKISENEETKTKTIKQISEFSVNNTYKYIRFTVNVDRSKIVLEDLDTEKEPKWNEETLLLNVLVEGKANLYQYEEGNFVKYFYSTGNHSKAEQLVFKEYKVGTQVGKNNFFRQQLYNLMKGEGNDMDKFKKVQYKKDPIVKLFNEYNGNSGQKVTDLTKKQSSGSVNLKITPGISFSSLDVSNGVSKNYFDFESKTGIRIGAEVEYVMPFNNNKWSIFADPNYQTFSGSGRKGNQQVKADYNYIELPFGARHYMYLNQNAKFFIDAAYVLTIPLGDPYIQFGGSKLDIEKNSGLALGGGFSYKQYSVELRHNFSHELLNYAYWSGSYNSTSIILGYKLL